MPLLLNEQNPPNNSFVMFQSKQFQSQSRQVVEVTWTCLVITETAPPCSVLRAQYARTVYFHKHDIPFLCPLPEPDQDVAPRIAVIGCDLQLNYEVSIRRHLKAD